MFSNSMCCIGLESSAPAMHRARHRGAGNITAHRTTALYYVYLARQCESPPMKVRTCWNSQSWTNPSPRIREDLTQINGHVYLEV